MRKIVDTVENYGRAEYYLKHEVEIDRWLHKNFTKKEILDSNPFNIAAKYNLRGFVIGNYVSQEERFYFLFKIKEQLRLLAKLKGGNNLGFGILTIAFGVEGRKGSLAHFNPSKCLINLNRGRKSKYKEILMGENSFVHEYGHFVDFVTGRRQDDYGFNFASEAHKFNGSTTESIDNISRATNIIMSDKDYMDELGKFDNSVYLSQDLEIFARLFEASITHIVNSSENLRGEFGRVFPRTYKQNQYYPESKIFKLGLDKMVVNSLKQTTISGVQMKMFDDL